MSLASAGALVRMAMFLHTRLAAIGLTSSVWPMQGTQARVQIDKVLKAGVVSFNLVLHCLLYRFTKVHMAVHTVVKVISYSWRTIDV